MTEVREIYAGRVVTLRLKSFLQPDGSMRLREIVEHAPGAAVVALDAEMHVLLVRQHRREIEKAESHQSADERSNQRDATAAGRQTPCTVHVRCPKAFR